MSQPNVVSLRDTDPLTLAHRRRDAAAVVVLKQAVEDYRDGFDVGAFAPIVRQYLAFTAAAGFLADAPGVGAMGEVAP